MHQVYYINFLSMNVSTVAYTVALICCCAGFPNQCPTHQISAHCHLSGILKQWISTLHTFQRTLHIAMCTLCCTPTEIIRATFSSWICGQSWAKTWSLIVFRFMGKSGDNVAMCRHVELTMYWWCTVEVPRTSYVHVCMHATWKSTVQATKQYKVAIL